MTSEYFFKHVKIGSHQNLNNQEATIFKYASAKKILNIWVYVELEIKISVDSQIKDQLKST